MCECFRIYGIIRPVIASFHVIRDVASAITPVDDHGVSSRINAKVELDFCLFHVFKRDIKPRFAIVRGVDSTNVCGSFIRLDLFESPVPPLTNQTRLLGERRKLFQAHRPCLGIRIEQSSVVIVEIDVIFGNTASTATFRTAARTTRIFTLSLDHFSVSPMKVFAFHNVRFGCCVITQVNERSSPKNNFIDSHVNLLYTRYFRLRNNTQT